MQVVKGGGRMERAAAAGRRGRQQLDGEGSGGGKEMAVAAGRRGWQAGSRGMERVAAGARSRWVDSVGVSVGRQHVGYEIHTGMGIGSMGA